MLWESTPGSPHNSAVTASPTCTSQRRCWRPVSSTGGAGKRRTAPTPSSSGRASWSCRSRAATFVLQPGVSAIPTCSRRSFTTRFPRAQAPRRARLPCVRASRGRSRQRMFGKLTWNAIPWDQPIPLAAGLVVVVALLGVLVWVIAKGHLPYLWHEWITSVDHKRIGVMYIVLAMLMLFRGFIDAVMMRSQQAIAFQSAGYLPPEHYNQIFSAHGTIMIFFAGMPFIIGLMNFVVPLQLGVRDVAFPTLNSTGFWLTATGALLVNISLVVGEFARTGWLPY